MVLLGTISKMVLQQVMVLHRTTKPFKEPFKNRYFSMEKDVNEGNSKELVQVVRYCDLWTELGSLVYVKLTG